MPLILRVAIPVPLPRLFDYRLDAALGPVSPGTRVLVPFGPRERVGIALEHVDRSDVADDKLKRVSRVLDPRPLLSDELLATLQWAARYYQHPLGAVLETALPVGLRQARALPLDGVRAVALSPAGRVALAEPAARRGTRTRALLERLADGPVGHVQLDTDLPGWRDSATVLRRRALIDTVALPTPTLPSTRLDGPTPTAQQHEAIEAIQASLDRFQPFLLEGITGSGKTEVYLRVIDRVLAHGGQALVLVPEIGLTPQTLRRFRDRFGPRVHALHSALAEGERTRVWCAAAAGDAGVILGTRSAVFAPLPNLRLIVVDEEHDASYKQQEGFRYSARDLAIVRAQRLGAPVVLGSATPSLESLANVEAGRYVGLRLDLRPGVSRLPTPRVVDVRSLSLRHGLANTTILAIRECLDRGEQALVFRNRRGYSPVLLCHDCGWHADCARCARPMTWHRGRGRLVCHHCAAERPVPAQCPTCRSAALRPQGHGTERLEETLTELFPHAALVRIDRETTRRRGALEALLDRLAPDQPGIYVGTQMLAKGHDLPNLTLVAILGVDEGLYSVDFRAGERLAQLIVQVSGRAGRAAKPGQVLLQTHHPEHPLLQALLRGGYRAVVKGLLVERREAELPPFGHLALLRAEAGQPDHALGFLADAAATARVDGVELLGPLPAPMPMRAGMHRAQLIASATERARLQAFLPAFVEHVRALTAARRVRWSIDVDPVDLY